MTRFKLRAIRLVNFHNFVDEAIEVRDGGHLFLLGDNGSGKTTVLDAVHYVLAGGELELNAAARLGGRRDEGRSLQGLVLRYDFEHGVRNEGGAIAYAAVELAGADGEPLTLGIGTEATTLDAKVTRWGFVARCPLAEIALVDEGDRPLGREDLRRRLGANQVFAHLAQYRKEVARRLFASERHYDEVVRFWGMAKAYREIVASARDFGALFERLLPTPDAAVFEEILRTLRALDDLELALRDLEGQTGYVRGLAELSREVAAHREAASRYGWLALAREREEAAATRARHLSEAARLDTDAARLDTDAEAARLAYERAGESLRRVERGDAAGALAAIRDAEARRAEVAGDRDRAGHDRREAEREAEAFARAAEARRRELAAAAAAAAAALERAADEAAEVPGELAAVHQLARELRALAAVDAPPQVPGADAAAADADALSTRARDRVLAASVAARSAAVARSAAADRVAELEAAGDRLAVPGLEPALRALATAGIAGRPLYELLEPAGSAAPEVLAAIEALATDAVLAAVVVAPGQVEQARRIVAAVAPELRVVVALACDVQLPAWCAQALAGCERDGLAALGAALSQPPALGELTPPHEDGALAIRGLGFQLAARAPRWIGSEARRRAHAEELAAARERLAAAHAAEAEAARAVRAAERALAAADLLARAVSAAGGPVIAAWHADASACQRSELAARACAEARRRHDQLSERLAAIEAELAGLRARAGGVDLDELDRRIAGLRAASERAHERWKAAAAAHAQGVAAAATARQRASEAAAVAAGLEPRLADAAHGLRAQLAALGSPLAGAPEDELVHYVRVTQRGDSFRSVESIRQRLADAERAADAGAAELERDGSRGVRALAHASRFGFTYDRARNQIEDRRGQPLAGVLAELERSIAEQRSVVNERTRTLMDTLVMGELARHLQGQIHSLHETIKGINRVLKGMRFGPSAYRFEIAPREDRAELIELVRRLSILDDDSRAKFRAWTDAHLDELRAAEDRDGPPALLDYRRWFEFKLRMSTTSDEGVELTQALRRVGSGGEQGVPNYLLVLALASLMFDAAGAAVRPLLFDEAFYGIDAGRRDQLLRLATDLGLQLFVASPDQDGATPAVRAATTLFVVKDADHDVHLAPYHYWCRAREPQPGLFEPPPLDAGAAACATGPAR